MTTLEVIIAELQRQADVSRSQGLGWFDADNPKNAVIDGSVDLTALAEAIERGLRK
jgi:hypothetical protein